MNRALGRMTLLLAAGLLLAGGACTPSKLTVSGVEPATGVVAGGENVVVKGAGFSPGKTALTVKFGKNDASNVTILAEDKIQVTTPAGTKGPADVVVTFDDGRTFRLAEAFLYRAPDQSQTRDVFLSGTKKPDQK